jgi:hypothetical protein
MDWMDYFNQADPKQPEPEKKTAVQTEDDMIAAKNRFKAMVKRA